MANLTKLEYWEWIQWNNAVTEREPSFDNYKRDMEILSVSEKQTIKETVERWMSGK